MKKIVTYLIILAPIMAGCGVSQEDHDTLQANYEELEETIKFSRNPNSRINRD